VHGDGRESVLKRIAGRRRVRLASVPAAFEWLQKGEHGSDKQLVHNAQSFFVLGR